jgi:hypothetical protein
MRVSKYQGLAPDLDFRKADDRDSPHGVEICRMATVPDSSRSVAGSEEQIGR